MVDTRSSTLPLETPFPHVRLENAVDGEWVDMTQLSAGKRGTLIMFVCNHCPFVVHIRQELVRAAHEALDRGMAVAAINSNDLASYPQDGPVAMKRLAKEERWRFPFLFDSTQDVARAFRAACSPDLYVFDASQRLAYHGQFDDSRPSNGKPVTGRDLRSALEAVASGRKPAEKQESSIGCSIKWSATGPRPGRTS